MKVRLTSLECVETFAKLQKSALQKKRDIDTQRMCIKENQKETEETLQQNIEENKELTAKLNGLKNDLKEQHKKFNAAKKNAKRYIEEEKKDGQAMKEQIDLLFDDCQATFDTEQDLKILVNSYKRMHGEDYVATDEGDELINRFEDLKGIKEYLKSEVEKVEDGTLKNIHGIAWDQEHRQMALLQDVNGNYGHLSLENDRRVSTGDIMKEMKNSQHYKCLKRKNMRKYAKYKRNILNSNKRIYFASSGSENEYNSGDIHQEIDSNESEKESDSNGEEEESDSNEEEEESNKSEEEEEESDSNEEEEESDSNEENEDMENEGTTESESNKTISSSSSEMKVFIKNKFDDKGNIDLKTRVSGRKRRRNHNLERVMKDSFDFNWRKKRRKNSY